MTKNTERLGLAYARHPMYEAYLALVQAAQDKTYCKGVVVVYPGKRFDKIVIDERQTGGSQRHVHAFVERETLDLYKAATWNAPAKGPRYNLIRDAELLKQRVEFTGGYLYKGAK